MKDVLNLKSIRPTSSLCSVHLYLHV